MYAQLIYFDGPRSAELVAATERAGRERITPAIEGDEQLRDQLVAVLVCRHDDGGELVVSVMKTREALARAGEVIMSTELLPGEDPALLSQPDRVEVVEVVDFRVAAGQPA